MFLTGKGGYDRDGQQQAKGQFLIIVADPDSKALRPELRAYVRVVELKQLGHWMMGRIELAGVQISLSGSYGHDGLPDDLDPFPIERRRPIFEQMLVLPQELQDAFWAGGGHNCAGSEAPAIRAWALANLPRLKQAIT